MIEPKITPPLELIQRWSEQFEAGRSLYAMFEDIYRAGADAELEACCEWIPKWTPWDADQFRAERRPKPLSLKELALEELTWVDKHLNMPLHNHCTAIHTIRRALEQLPDHEPSGNSR
jgi:hypothetical protein